MKSDFVNLYSGMMLVEAWRERRDKRRRNGGVATFCSDGETKE